MKNKNLNILVFAGCTDKKLISKLSTLLDAKNVENVYLVRNTLLDYSHPKLKQYPVIKAFRKIVILREINRVFNGIGILLTKKIDLILGIHFIMHCIYTYFLAKIFRKKYAFLLIESPDKYEKKEFLLKTLKDVSLVGVRGSNSLKTLVDLGVPTEKFFVAQNEFDLPNIKKESGKKIYDIIYIGNFVDEKDLPLWVDVIEKVKERKPKIKAIMLGDGIRLEDIILRIKNKGLEKNIELAGRQADVYKYIQQSKILLMTSKTEGLPMVAVESMACGIPCVLPNVGDISDLIKNEENGITIDSRDPEDFAKKIVKLLNDDSQYTKLSSEALKSIKVMASSTTHKQLVKVWEEELEKHI